MKTLENFLYEKTKEMSDQLSDDINTFIISDQSVASITRFLQTTEQRHCIQHWSFPRNVATFPLKIPSRDVVTHDRKVIASVAPLPDPQYYGI